VRDKDGNGSGLVRMECLGTQNQNPNLKPEPAPNFNSGLNLSPKPKFAGTRNPMDNPKPESWYAKWRAGASELANERPEELSVDAFYGPTHECARSRGARRSSLQHLQRGAVRPVRATGQTGRCAERRRSNERSLGKDPIGASVRRVALGSTGQQGRPQTPWRREKNSMSRLEK